MMFERFRRQLALIIYPDLGKPVVAITTETGAPSVGLLETKHHLSALAEALAAHQGVTHFAISMRAMGKGDFFKRLSRPGADCRTMTATRLMAWFSENWPGDLEWPRHIPRPQKSKKEAA